MIERAYIMGAFFLIDMVATFFYIRAIKKKFPKLDYKYFEYNEIVSWAWKKFGFYKGTLVAPVLMTPFWLVTAVGVQLYEKWFYFALGTYTLLFLIHFANLTSLNKDSPMKQLYEKAYGGD